MHFGFMFFCFSSDKKDRHLQCASYNLQVTETGLDVVPGLEGTGRPDFCAMFCYLPKLLLVLVST